MELALKESKYEGTPPTWRVELTVSNHQTSHSASLWVWDYPNCATYIRYYFLIEILWRTTHIHRFLCLRANWANWLVGNGFSQPWEQTPTDNLIYSVADIGLPSILIGIKQQMVWNKTIIGAPQWCPHPKMRLCTRELIGNMLGEPEDRSLTGCEAPVNAETKNSRGACSRNRVNQSTLQSCLIIRINSIHS